MTDEGCCERLCWLNVCVSFRWAAREALKPLSVSRPAGALGVRRSAPPPGPDGPGAALASLLLARAEAAMGRPEASEEAQRHVGTLGCMVACSTVHHLRLGGEAVNTRPN